MDEVTKKLMENSPARKRAYLGNLRSLVKSGKLEKYFKILTNFNFITAKINHPEFGVQILIEDYDWIDYAELLTNQEYDLQKINILKLIQKALRLSAHILATDETQLVGQLWGRLLSFKKPEILVLLEQAKQSKIICLRPLTPSLTPPDEYLLRTLSGHSSSVNALAITPDDKYVISGSHDKTLKVWNWQTGKEEKTLIGHSDSVNAVAVTPDGKQVISGSNDKTLKIWDLVTGKSVVTLTGHSGSVNAVFVTPNGKQVISASSDNTIKVWNLKNWNEELTLTGNGDSVNAVTITPDSEYVVFHSNCLESLDCRTIICHNYLNLYKLKTGELNSILINSSLNQNQFSQVITITPDRFRVISSSSNKIVIRNLQDGEELLALVGHSDFVNAITVTPNGKYVISGAFDKTIGIWNLTTEKQTILKGHADAVNAVLVTSNSRWLLSGSSDKTVKIWDLASSEKNPLVSNNNIVDNLTIPLPSHSKAVNAIAITRNGKQAISISEDETIKKILISQNFSIKDCNSRKQQSGDPRNKMPNRVPAQKAGTLTATWYWLTDKLDVWAFYFLELPSMFFLNENTKLFQSCAVTLDGNQAIFGSTNNGIKVHNVELEKTFYLKSYIRYFSVFFRSIICFLYNMYMIVQLSRFLYSLWDIFQHFIYLIFTSSFKIATNGEGEQILDFLFNCTISFRDIVLSTLFVLVIINTIDFINYESVNALSLTQDDQYLISASNNNTIKFWNLNKRKKLFTFKSHADRVTALAITPNGNYLIYASNDKTIRVFNLKSRKHSVPVFKGHCDLVTTLAVTPDGKWVISGSNDSTVKIWDLTKQEEIFTFKGHIESVNAVTVTPNGQQVISVSSDKTLKVWDLQSGSEIASFTGESSIKCCAVYPDGVTVVAGEASGCLHFLRLEGVEA